MRNPVSRLKAPEKDDYEPRIVEDNEELQKLLGAALETRQHFSLILFLLGTGLRRGLQR
jgi:hypothetical protein